MLHVKEAKGSVDEVVKRLEAATAANQFGILGIHDLKQKMNAKGVSFASECRILEVCNPGKAKAVLDSNMAISTALPCRISVYEEAGKVKIATLKATGLLALFDEPALAVVAQEVEASMERIIDEACG